MLQAEDPSLSLKIRELQDEYDALTVRRRTMGMLPFTCRLVVAVLLVYSFYWDTGEGGGVVGEEREGVVGEEREGVVEEEREGVVEEEREGVVGEEREGVVEGKEREGVVEGKERGR